MEDTPKTKRSSPPLAEVCQVLCVSKPEMKIGIYVDAPPQPARSKPGTKIIVRHLGAKELQRDRHCAHFQALLKETSKRATEAGSDDCEITTTREKK
jgi:hypothetical protein